MKLGQRPAQPPVGFFLIAESAFGERLDAQQTNGAIGLVDRQRLVLVRTVTAGALGDDKPLDLLLAQARLGQPLERR